MSRPIIYPYKVGSASARALKNSLLDVRGKIVREDGNYVPFRNHTIINWGNPREPQWNDPRVRGRVTYQVLNRWDRVADASNKLRTYNLLHLAGVPVPSFVTDRQAIPTDWGLVVCRHRLRASGGDGIQLVYTNNEAVPDCPLYTKYEKKKHEFRVHIFMGNVIDIQQKRRVREAEVDYKIRNHDRGWVFCRQEVNIPESCLHIAIESVRTLGLSFGAVDIGWNEYYQKAFVYEVNTAPGLEATTLENYVNAIKEVTLNA